jgi:hypothetical protein
VLLTDEYGIAGINDPCHLGDEAAIVADWEQTDAGNLVGVSLAIQWYTVGLDGQLDIVKTCRAGCRPAGNATLAISRCAVNRGCRTP